MKALIFDSGALINLSMNGLLYILEDLKKKFDGKFLITEEVKYETVDRPVGIQRFEFGALQVQNLIDLKILELPESVGISGKDLKGETKKFSDSANHFLQIEDQWVHLVEDAEMSCLALSSALDKKGIDNLIAIDERTTRMLSENPANLEKLMSEKLHKRVSNTPFDLQVFNKFKFIRSSELVFVAYKKGVVKLSGKKVLEALLYATKFKGSSISFEEIEVLKKL